MRRPRSWGSALGSLVTLYQWRLRQRLAQELLAAGGIVIGVALVFGVLLANTSITGSAGQLVHQLVGSARLQLAARSAEGFDEQLAEAAGRLPGVQVATPILRENATIIGPTGREPVQLDRRHPPSGRAGQRRDAEPGLRRAADRRWRRACPRRLRARSARAWPAGDTGGQR